MGKFDNQKNYLYNMGLLALNYVKAYITQVEKAEMTNEQFFINFEDALNELSIKDHNENSIA